MRNDILIRLFGLLVLFSLVLSSCGSKRKAAKPTPVDSTDLSGYSNSLKSFEMSNLTYFTFSGRAKAKINFDKSSHDATAHIRIERDKAIWISVTAIFNVEVARILITPDSVKILNKFPSRELISKPFHFIHQYTNPGLTFSTLQDILVGNVSTELLRAEEVQVLTSDSDVILVGAKDRLTFQYGMDSTYHRPYATKLEDRGVQQKLDVAYHHYNSIDGHVFPQQFVLNVSGEGIDIQADLKYNRLIFNKPVEMPF